MTRALFYPCCGSIDIIKAMNGFAHLADCVHGADLFAGVASGLRRSWNLDETSSINHAFTPELKPNGCGGVRMVSDPLNQPSGVGMRHEYIARRIGGDGAAIPFIWHHYDAVEALNYIERISVFFFRRDGPADGEGSSGVRWLDDVLLRRVLAKLEPGGLIVTDGAAMRGDAPQDALWKAPRDAAAVQSTFEFADRQFTYERVFCADRVPTLVWRVQ